MKGFKVSSYIVPVNDTDTYPTNLDIFGKGGIHSVDSIATRDLITLERRSEGMLSYTKHSSTMYSLLGGNTNEHWVKFFEFRNGKIIIDTSSLPDLEKENIWIGDNDNRPKAQKTISSSNLPNLPNEEIWIGNSSNRPQSNKTIGVANLPDLGGTIASGKIWRGDGFGRPEESNALTEAIGDIATLNSRFLTGNFIMGDALVHASYPKAQFLVDLQDGLLKKTRDKLEKAIEGTDYIGISEDPQTVNTFFATIDRNSKWLKFSNIKIVANNSLENLNNVEANIFIANEGFRTPKTLTAGQEVGTRILKVYENIEGEITEFTKSFNLKAVNNLVSSLTYILPSNYGNQNDFLVDDGVNEIGERKLAFKPIIPTNLNEGLLAVVKDNTGKLNFSNASLTKNKFWIGNEENVPTESSTFPITSLPDLQKDNIWIGDINNRPVIYNIKTGFIDAKFILQQPSNDLSNAQALSSLSSGILKNTTLTGELSIASGGGSLTDDYVTPFALLAQKEEVEAFAAAEAAAAEVAANLYADGVGVAATASAVAISNAKLDAEMLPYLPIIGYTYGFQISGDISDKTNAVRDFFKNQMLPYNYDSSNTYGKQIKDDIAQAEHRIDNLNITLQGDITGSGNIASHINTKFVENPFFVGKQYIRIPTGYTFERPSESETKVGMMRINLDGSPYVPPKPVIINGTPDQIEVVNQDNTFTISLADNPKLKGKSFIKMPTGSTSERPFIYETGMLRYNTEI